MSLASETSRVAGGGKNALKTILQKLGVTVGSQKIDQYASLAAGISNKLLPDNLVSSSTASLYGKSSTATVNEILAAIKPLIDSAQTSAASKCSVVSGSYVGTGTAGSKSKNSLTFNFKPRLLFITLPITGGSAYESYFLTPSNSEGKKLMALSFTLNDSTNSGHEIRYELSGNTISWYDPANYPTAGKQLNYSGYTYYYVAIGEDE